MTRHLHIDPVTGVSGDMLLGGLLDLGAPIDALRHELERLGVDGWSLDGERVTRHGLTGVLARVATGDTADHRAASTLADMVERAGLDQRIAANATAIIRRIAAVEASIHGVPIDDVHLHEVGALDTLIDVVGVCAALHLLGVESVSVGPLPTGSGTVMTAHGELPVPAPATLALIAGTGIEWRVTDDPMELVTPTGAAIVAHVATAAAGLSFSVERVGYGFGASTRLPRANVCRLLLGDTASGGAGSDVVIELAMVIDDQPAEQLAHAVDAVLAAAVDAWLTPVVMKKGRLGSELTVLCSPADEQRIVDMLFELTTTLGMRRSERQRHVADRREVVVDVAGQPVRVKMRSRGGVELGAKAEHDDCVRAAAACGMSPIEVARRAVDAATTQAIGLA